MNAKNVMLEIGERILFEIDELKLYKGERVGLIGKNGEGKSQLLKYLVGDQHVKNNVEWFDSFGYLQQLEQIEGKPLSGGEQTLQRLNQLFQEDQRILLLDEPTNHLDWRHTDTFISELKNHHDTFVIVSHNRYVLDQLCTTIWEIENGKIQIYNGNYSAYVEQKALLKKQQQEEYDAYVKEKNRLIRRYQKKQQQAENMDRPPSRMSNSEWQLHKGKAAGKKGKVERVSKVIRERIDRMEKVDKPFEWESVKMEYVLQTPIHRKTIMNAHQLEKRYSNRLLYKVDALKIRTGNTVALIGENGSGKTSLLQQLMLDQNESIEFAANVKVGYFNQNLFSMPESDTVLAYVKSKSSLPEYLIRVILARLGFFEGDMMKSISNLSGGERVKLAFAKLLVGDYNLLILDEPTNHLDLYAMEALEGLIKDYPGTIVFVSHDRQFINNTANSIWMIENNTIKTFNGSYQEWEASNKEVKQLTVNEEQKLRLKNKLSELISLLSVAEDPIEKMELDKQYKEVLSSLKEIS
ncbi:ATP-binding cassette domain-containing protein [Bacillus spongiae]|uniref:ATP-binding cassette domain-containing protein n=1 Tax=Bacillus spongiae TaxID=2683610 RepID=A0ABU8HHK4_9BACI